MGGVPEFIAQRVYKKNSFITTPDGFSFRLVNPFTPASITSIAIELDEQPVTSDQIILQDNDGKEWSGSTINADTPYTMPLNKEIKVIVNGVQPGDNPIRLSVSTVEWGKVSFNIPRTPGAAKRKEKWKPRRKLMDFLKGRQRAIMRIDAEAVIGEIDPRIYGHFIEHVENCIYGGVWSENGDRLRDDVLRLIQPIKPTVLRYPGGNFASAYHWEDGIGPREQRPHRYDPAWKSEESNQFGTDEFIAFCQQIEAEPYLCVNDATGTPEEAARWVAYCNESAETEQGRRRAANGHPEPYGVKLWGVGNEVWGHWQTGHTDAESYVKRLRPIVEAMRAVDPTIKIVAVGDAIAAEDNVDAWRWNETVLRQAGDLINFISFHSYQPGPAGWQDDYDLETLYYTVCAAPQSVERIIVRMNDLIQQAAPGKGIKVALDEWNLWLSPPEGAPSMHAVNYTLRDALHTASMLNVFQRQSKHLTLANLAQLVNVLPLIVTNERQAYATPIYYPFEMYRHMEPVALDIALNSPTFKSDPLGNIEAMDKVPYVDATATCSRSQQRVVLGIVNRHPTARMDLSVRLSGFGGLQPTKGWLLQHSDLLAENSFANPENVKSREVDLRNIGKRKRFTLDLPPSCVAVITLE